VKFRGLQVSPKSLQILKSAKSSSFFGLLRLEDMTWEFPVIKKSAQAERKVVFHGYLMVI
jgi:hypothetical protein